MMSLPQAQDFVNNRLDDGVRCPCCDQFAKIYKRKINAQMARVLIAMHRTRTPWVQLTSLGLPRADEAKLRYWALIEEDTSPRHDGGRSGYWRITDKGRLFVLGGITVPKYALVYNGHSLGLDGPPVTITETLGSGFDYAELMSA